jgi:hypothetical protein
MPENTHGLLAEVVAKVRCKPDWSFRLQEEDGALLLVITVVGQDSYNEENDLRVAHFHPVPMATYNEKSWARWIFEQCRRVENHELGEWFRVGDRRPFAPLHGPGEDPYTVHEYRDKVDAQTLQNGSLAELEV